MQEMGYEPLQNNGRRVIRRKQGREGWRLGVAGWPVEGVAVAAAHATCRPSRFTRKEHGSNNEDISISPNNEFCSQQLFSNCEV